MSTRLTSHLKGSDKKDFATRIIENKPILDRIVTLLEGDLKKSRNIQLDRESFRNPEWANQAAYEFGYQKALDDAINLMTLRKENAE
jgi:hypothetical protein